MVQEYALYYSKTILLSDLPKRAEPLSNMVYRIYDTQTLSYWEKRKGNKTRQQIDTIWTRPEHAIASFGQAMKNHPITPITDFKEQARFVVHEFKLSLL